MAYHFSVFALSVNVLVIGFWHNLYYKDKIEGLFNAFGHMDRALDDRTISADTLFERICKVADTGNAETNSVNAALVTRHEEWIAHLLGELGH